MYRQDPDRLIVARLHAVATRHGWTRPEGEVWAATVAELREIATVRAKPRRRSVHPPAETLRTDLLGQVAGILLGTAPSAHPEKHLIGVELLRDAGADAEQVQRWILIGLERAGSGGPPSTDAPPRGWP
ncbi:hypothetical protein [Actinomadura sp. 3N508]|uniref:hypothetical protein n=1 Tax=Actinomadura sp. 3N508 TaxID=3375153 RepID=UPI00379ABA97